MPRGDRAVARSVSTIPGAIAVVALAVTTLAIAAVGLHWLLVALIDFLRSR